MAKANKKIQQFEEQEMTLEQSKAYRAALYVAPPKRWSEEEKREAFRVFWASNKSKYGKAKGAIEKVLWLHLKTIKMDTPDSFSQGLANFGLKKVK